MSIETEDSMIHKVVISRFIWIFSLGPFHTRGKGHDHELVRVLNYHPKAGPWVLREPFCGVTCPQTKCVVIVDHVGGPLHIYW